MKHLVPLFALLAAVPLFAQPPRRVGEADPVPANGFTTFAELKKWAASSSFGGGQAGELTLSGTKVFYSDRMVTSGVPTAELIFYTANPDGIRPFLILPVQRREYQVGAEQNEIVVRTYDPAAKKWRIALRITPWMLPAPLLPRGV